ncbi:MAG: ATP synthase F1 subunit delta [Planctomycetota bacterium]|jgi:F-type H+-transporting ATPase subunit delta
MGGTARHIIHEIYSDVMFELAEESGRVEAVMDDLEAVSKVLHDEPEFLSLLTLGHVKEDEKAKMIRRVFKGKIDSLTLDFLCVLAKRNRMNFVHGIGDRYQDLLDEKKNISRVVVTLAKEPDEAQIEKIRADIKDAISAEVKLSVTVDPEIIGGIVIKKGDLMVDNSVRSILNRTVNAIMEKSKEKIHNQNNK